jgi:hypothetical protein
MRELARWKILAVGLGMLALATGCQRELPDEQPGLTELQRAASILTGRIESEYFVFHFQPGDGGRAEVDRSEAYHRWAVQYLGVTPPKKIDFYMFPSSDVMARRFGTRFGGSAFPEEFALATAYSWHNHECFHLYTCLLGNPPRLFGEGMPVAHEFDPYNDVWVSRWNRAEPWGEPHVQIARQLKEQGLLYPLDSILESGDFNAIAGSETVKIAYEEAGAWVSYLVETYGIECMKRIVADLRYDAAKEAIQSKFLAVYGVSIADAEIAWLAWLDDWRAE